MKFALALLAALLTASLSAETQFYAASAEGNVKDQWNASYPGRTWTADGGATWQPAATGNTYHTNGWQVKAGPIGNAAGGKPNPFVFAGAKLVIDGYNDESKLSADATADGELFFELKPGSKAGPRDATVKKAVKATYAADIVTAPTTGETWRSIRGSVGVISLDGTLRLDGNTRFTTGSINDMYFLINAAVSGSGDIDLSGGSGGSKIQNSWLLWAFRDLRAWKGARITVQHRHTISFSGPADFMKTNPDVMLVFPASGPGYLNLSADVSIGAEKLRYGKHKLKTGIYTAADLNALYVNEWGGNPAYPFASGPARLFVGQPIAK